MKGERVVADDGRRLIREIEQCHPAESHVEIWASGQYGDDTDWRDRLLSDPGARMPLVVRVVESWLEERPSFGDRDELPINWGAQGQALQFFRDSVPHSVSTEIGVV